MVVYTGGWTEDAPLWATGIIADCGLYTGEWPPYAVTAIPADAGEVDLLVAIPNPDGLNADLIDESYPTDYTYTWRDGPDPKDDAHSEYTVNASGGSSGTSTTTPPGAHLYLIWYDVDFDPIGSIPQPSVAALDLVPAGMCAGAAGVARPSRAGGAWSAWQPGITASRFAATVGRTIIANAASTVLSGGGAVATDAQADLDALLLLAQAGSGTRVGPSSTTDVSITTDKTASIDAYDATVRLAQGMVTLDGSGWETDISYDDSVLDSLVYGFDYVLPPDALNMVEFEGDAALAGWGDESLPVSVSNREFKFWGSTLATFTYTDPEIRYGVVESALLTDDDPMTPAWPAYGDGTTVGTFTPSTDHGVTTENSDSGTVALDMSGVGAVGQITIISQTEYQGPLAQPVLDYTVVAPPANNDAVEGLSNQAGYSLLMHLTTTGIETVGTLPVPLYAQPRWRYWVPGAGPLRTIGDHFRSVSGVDVKSLIPGVGWVKVRRGT